MATLSTGSPSVIWPILRMEGCSRCVPSVIWPFLRIGTRYIGCLNYARINPPSKTFQLEIPLDPLFRKLFVLAQTFEHTKVLAGWTFC